MKLTPFAALAFAVVMAGCSTDQPSSAQGDRKNSVASSTATDTKSALTPTTAPASESESKADPAPKETAPPVDPSTAQKKPPVRKDPKLPFPAVATQKPVKNPPVSSSDWVKSSISATELGTRADKALRSEGLLGNITFAAHWWKGDGICTMQVRVAKPKLFYITYPVLEDPQPFRNNILIGDGFRMGQRTVDGLSPVKPGDPQFTVSGPQLVQAWPFKFQRLMFAGLVNPSKGGIAPYFKALSSGIGGYKVRIDERNVTFGTKALRQIRLLATRPGSKTVTPSQIEMIFDANRYFMMHTRIDEEPIGKKKPTHIDVSASWRLPFPLKDFPQKDFSLRGMSSG